MENIPNTYFLITRKESPDEVMKVLPHTFGDGYVLFAPILDDGKTRSEDEASFIRFENPDQDEKTLFNEEWSIEKIEKGADVVEDTEQSEA